MALTKVRAEVNNLTDKKQSPWSSTNLTGLFYMKQVAALESNTANDATPVAAPAVTTVPVEQSDDTVELEFWRSVKNSYKPDELKLYLDRYPDGAFAPIARARLAALETSKDDSNSAGTVTPSVDPAVRTAESSRETEDALDLGRSERRDVQRRLKALGFETNTDGRFTAETRRAIKNWQGARNYPDSGYLNKLQLNALRAEALPKPAVTEHDEDNDHERVHRRVRHYETHNRHRSSGGGGGRGGPPAAMGALFGGVAHGLFRR